MDQFNSLTVQPSSNFSIMYIKRFHTIQGISLLELALVIMLIGVIAGVGGRAIQSINDADRFQYTVHAMETIRAKLVGNPRLIQSGHRCDFGYIGRNGAFPANLGVLRSEYCWITPEPTINTTDGWGRAYAYNGPSGSGGNITLLSKGSTGNSGGTGFDTDLEIQIDVNNQTQNAVRVFCVDRYGALLTDGLIQRVALSDGVTATDLTYEAAKTSWSGSGFVVGPCYIQVHVQAAYDAELSGNQSPITTMGVIYPKEMYSANTINEYEVRLPGSVRTGL